MCFHVEFHPPGMSGTGQKVCVGDGGWWWWLKVNLMLSLVQNFGLGFGFGLEPS